MPFPQKLLKAMHEGLMDDIQRKLTELWKDHNKEDTKRQVEIAFAKKHQNTNLAKEDSKEMHGFIVPKNLNMTTGDGYNDRWDIERKLSEQFKKHFKTKHAQLHNQLLDQIQKLPLELLLSAAVDAFPWLQKEIDEIDMNPWGGNNLYNTVISQFVCHFLSRQIPLLSTYPNMTWNELMESANQGGPTFPNLDLSHLAQDAAGYPYLKYKDCFVVRTPSLPSIERVGYRKEKDLYNHPISITDLFVYLHHLTPEKMVTGDVEGVKTPSIAPIPHQELLKLTPSQVGYIETLIVNIGYEDTPLWVVLKKTGLNNWTAYVSDEIKDNAQTQLHAFIEKNKLQVNYQCVDYNLNLQNSIIPRLITTAEWHAVLFGRVLPFCLDNQDVDLSNYRTNTPISLLLEFTLKLCQRSKQHIHESISNGKPLSESNLEDLVRDFNYWESDARINMKINYLLSNPGFFRDPKPEFGSNSTPAATKDMLQTKIMDALDSKRLVIPTESPEQKQQALVLADPSSEKILKYALYLIYHNTDLISLQMPAIAKVPNGKYSSSLRELIRYNTSIQTVIPHARKDLEQANTYLAESMSCAARNRFLHSVVPADSFRNVDGYVFERKRLWETTGTQITTFFAEKGQHFNLELSERLSELNKVWEQEYYSHTQKPQEESERYLWELAQITQMGVQGLESLFNRIKNYYIGEWKGVYISSPPNLSCIFDLNGSINDEASAYTVTLAYHLRTVLNNNKGCGPIFNTLSLLLPEQPSTIQKPLLEIFSILNEQSSPKPEQGSAITLYQLDISQRAECASLLDALEAMANAQYKPLTVVPIIPAWDRACFTGSEDRALKAQYKRIQNTILNNQRLAKNPELNQALEPLYLSQQDKINPQVLINNHTQLKEQSFEGDDLEWPLDSRSGQSLGIQQQLQQMQQQEQEQEQEQEDMSEKVYEISQYRKDLSQLITRHNIDQTCAQDWDKIPQNIKNQSGWEGNNLAQLFSLWVGSDRDAKQVITKIEPKAITKLMRNARFLKFGLSRDNLPPGFSLSYSDKVEGLILCYSKARKKEDRQARAALPLDKTNPFTVLLHKPKRSKTFHGDYREFTALGKLTTSEQKLLWTYLAKEDEDQVRIKMTNETLNQLNIAHTGNNATVQMQHFTVEGQVPTGVKLRALSSRGTRDDEPSEAEQSVESCLLLLKNQLEGKFPNQQKVIDYFLDPHSSLSFTEHNLKAFGQLFYDFEAENPPMQDQNGIAHFIHLAQSILDLFGEDALSIWKNRLLDPCQNMGECLEQGEVKALALSIVTLKNPEAECYKNVWWALIDAHGKSVGHMKYADLWYGFQKIIRLLEQDHLILNEQALLNYLSQVNHFNGQVFLDRLFFILNSNHNKNLPKEINQNILNCLDQIDWLHNGFYYAARYEQYNFWDNSLQLNQFQFSALPDNPGYLPKMDASDFEHFKVQSLRFAQSKLHLEPAEFNVFKSIIEEYFSNLEQPHAQLILRLFVASMAIGSDRIMKIDREQLQRAIHELKQCSVSDLELLNKAFKLENLSTSATLSFTQLPLILKAAEASNRTQEMGELAFVTSCANALNCYSSPYVQENLSKDSPVNLLIKTLKAIKKINKAATTFYFNATPWVYITNPSPADFLVRETSQPSSSPYHQVQILSTQLQTIQFDQITYLPDYDSISSCIYAMNNYGSPQQSRENWVKDIKARGCALKWEQANSRPLTEEEVHSALKQISPHLEDNFKKETTEQLFSFFTNHVAVESQGTNQDKDVYNLIREFMSIDNKAHYNELGQVLGLLIEVAKNQSKKGTSRYSCKQLTHWLYAITSEGASPKEHYPLNMLKEILDFEAQNSHSSLLNEDLNQLKDKYSNKEDAIAIMSIATSKIPSHFKGVLTKLQLSYKSKKHSDKKATMAEATKSFVELEKENVGKGCLKALEQLLNQAVQEDWPNKKAVLKLVAETPDSSVTETPALFHLWQESRIKLMKLICEAKGNIESEYFDQLEEEYPYFQILFLKAGEHLDLTKKLNEDAKDLLSLLRGLQYSEKNSLLSYYSQTGPVPSIAQLLNCATNKKNASEIIHHFETITQATQEDGQSKRNYSISEKENKGLIRVLSGFKRKGQGSLADEGRKKLLSLLYYCNNYSQMEQLSSIPFTELLEKIEDNRNKIMFSRNVNKKQYASVQLLACMREVLLRKTGKWANHTQMLDLIYAAVNDGDNLLHQVKTGQGKSIITLMRASYLALNGKVVDVFSAKDSLSKRDHREFSHVLDALGISNAHITSDSPADSYHLQSEMDGVGAVNFATIGNFSLFQSRLAWQKERYINLKEGNRVAFIDECDHVLQDEETQFNYSDNDASTGLYNFDDWVYRLAYDFYLEHRESFVDKATGISTIHRNTDLKNLCEQIQQQSIVAPKQSTFVKKFIIPALDNNKDTMEKRDNALKQLLMAAHMAQNLQQDINYCTRPVQRTMANGDILQTRFAKVIIDNQIKDGSTYSDLVQQFLHVRLNKEAIDKGESPNYFVEPNSQITLSSNAKYVLTHFYDKIEGCTGTAGGESDLAEYEKTYNISHVVKLPTHEERATEFLGMDFCEDQDAQIKKIVDCILNYQDRPLLITCADDIEVKKLADLIKKKLHNRKPDYNLDNLIVDTNDSGKSENEIVPLSGAAGRVTLSSRMGRGTDIKPESEAGLMVLRTYPTISRINKQEMGRQGRNGARGTCLEIVDHTALTQEYELLKSSPSKQRLEKLVELYSNRTQAKVDNSEQGQSKKWNWLTSSEDVPEKYIMSQAVAQLKHEQKKLNERFLRRKEYLLASIAGEVLQLLQKNYSRESFDREALQESWMNCRKSIETAWATRLTGHAYDSEDTYKSFAEAAEQAISLLKSEFMEIKIQPSTQFVDEGKRKGRPGWVTGHVSSSPEYKDEFAAVVSCYQNWTQGAQIHLYSEPPAEPQILRELFGRNDLNQFFDVLFKASHSELPKENRKLLFDTLAQLPQPQVYLFAHADLAKVFQFLADNLDHKDFKKHMSYLPKFFNAPYFRNIDPKNSKPGDAHKRGLLLQLCMNIAVCKFIKREKLTEKFLNCFCEQIIHHHWEELDQQFVDDMSTVFASKARATEALTHPLFENDLPYFIELVLDNSVPELTDSELQEFTEQQKAKYKESRERSEHKVHRLVEFLETHSEKVRNGQSVVRPLFNLTLNQSTADDVDNYLPQPDFLGPMSLEAEGKIWAFIAKRQPVKEGDIQMLQQFLTVNRINAEVERTIIQPIADLPIHLSIPYIVRALENTLSQTNLYQFHSRLKELQEAGTELNQFLLNTGVISQVETNSTPLVKNKSLLDAAITRFNQEQNPAKNKLLFSTLNQNCQLGAKVLLELAPKIAEGQLDKSTLQLFADINLIMGKDSKMQEDLSKDIQNGKPLTVHYEFLAAVNHQGLSPEVLDKLWEARAQGKIDSLQALKHSIKACIKTIELLEKRNWKDYFAEFDKNKELRVDIMTMVHQNIIALDDDFTKKCYEHYSKLASRCIKTPERPTSSSKRERESKQQQMISSFRQVSGFCKELSVISNLDIKPSAQAPESMIRFFKDKKSEYRKEWWKNKTRKQQASLLFTQLKNLNSDENYYQKALDIVWETQKDILAKDKNTKKNTKGYSRLYDITIQMTIEIAKQCLSNENLTPANKAMLCERMDRQRDLAIATLIERLPEGHQYKNLLAGHAAEKGSLERVDFKKGLGTIYPEKVPKHLRYLVTNMQYFLKLGDEVNKSQEAHTHIKPR